MTVDLFASLTSLAGVVLGGGLLFVVQRATQWSVEQTEKIRLKASRLKVPANVFDFALVAMLGLLGLRIFEACGADIADVGEEHGHRVLRVHSKGPKIVLVACPRRLDARSIDRSPSAVMVRSCSTGRGARMDRRSATRRLRHMAQVSVVRLPRMHPYMLRHTFVTTMLDAGVDLRDVQIAARHADPRTTMRYDRSARTSTATPTTSLLPTWPRAPEPNMPINT